MNWRKGFTLIELLVVISIISLLTSIVLSSLTEAKTRAVNSKINQAIRQYRIALELYRNDHGSYPIPTPSQSNSWCLGVGYPNQLCGFLDGDPYHQSTEAGAPDLAPYLASLAPVSTTLFTYSLFSCPANYPPGQCVAPPGSAQYFMGVSYTYGPDASGNPTAYLTWGLKGANRSCDVGSAYQIPWPPPDTLCGLILTNS